MTERSKNTNGPLVDKGEASIESAAQASITACGVLRSMAVLRLRTSCKP